MLLVDVAPPATLSSIEREEFSKLVDTLRKRRIDPAARRELIADYVRATGRIEALRAEEAKAVGAARLQLMRAVNVATAERRRLHQVLFGNERPGQAEAAVPEPTDAQLAQADADEAWRKFFFSERRAPGSSPPSEIALKAKYGEPSWNALLYRTPDAQAAAERAIAKSYHRGGRPDDDDDEQ